MRMPLLRLVGLWLPPLLLMGVIFWFSSQESLNSGLGVFDLIGRKLIHFAQYALLCLLWWRPLRTVMRSRHAILLAFSITTLYAASDEFHQTFVDGRVGSPIDWAIDTAGAAAAAWWLMRARSRARAGVR
jgi:VanZ family protein